MGRQRPRGSARCARFHWRGCFDRRLLDGADAPAYRRAVDWRHELASTDPHHPARRPGPCPADTSTPAINSKGAWLMWPAQGDVITKFGEGGSKGIDIGGKLGEPVKAAAAGRVVYAGSGLRAYGQMIIVKHSNDFLTAYAHNGKLLVKEGDTVRQGATIAEMGNGPGNKPLLHFELRKSGQ